MPRVFISWLANRSSPNELSANHKEGFSVRSDAETGFKVRTTIYDSCIRVVKLLGIPSFEFRIEGLGFEGLEIRFGDSGRCFYLLHRSHVFITCSGRVIGLGLRVKGLGFRVQGLGFKV